MKITRREFIKASGILGLGFYGFQKNLLIAENKTKNASPYGKLIKDPQKILDLPNGFSYHVFSKAGELMADGLRVPPRHDGMASFRGPGGTTILIRNHEIGPYSDEMGSLLANYKSSPKSYQDKFYDQGRGKIPGMGGTTTLVYNTNKKKLEKHFLSLAGTYRNCAGGPTPWQTWISCEEHTARAQGDIERDHGYCFEVPISLNPSLTSPVPLKAMGRFNHEAVAVHPTSGTVYLTEDRQDGLLYRFLPKVKGQLSQGGKLEALKIEGEKSFDTRNWSSKNKKFARKNFPINKKIPVQWIDLKDVESPQDDLRYQGNEKGAARFTRGEGLWANEKEVYWTCTDGGRNRKGQIFRYFPSPDEGNSEETKSPGMLELFSEPNNSKLLEYADNITISPWGDLFVCEDGPGKNFIVGITANGDPYRFGRNALNKSEFAGANFSPDGSTLFVNIQSPGLTLAITGPWARD